MDVIKDINFTGDISLEGAKEHYSLDLYLPIDSDSINYQQYRNNLLPRTKNVTDGETNKPTSDMSVDFDKKLEGLKDRTLKEQNCASKFRKTSSTLRSPFVIFIHGGGWRRGDRDAWKHYLYYDVNFMVSLMTWIFGTYGNVGESFALNGIPCAVISYPLTELGMPWVFFEMLASYIQSCFVVFLSIFLFVAMAVLCRMSSDIHNSPHWSYMHGRMNESHWRERLLLVMLITNLLMALLLTIRRRKFNLSKTHSLCLWTCVVLFGFPYKHFSTNWLCQIVLVTFIAVQYTILSVRLTRAGRSVKDQVKVVSKAIEWAELLNDRMDTDIFVMGHSAGGHLACLSAIELQNRESRIKGVISVSGIYDVRCLHTPFIRRFYLYPTFGHQEHLWQEASPNHLVKKGKHMNIKFPTFLLISAEKDLFLKPQSWEFYRTLREAEVDCSHIEIKRTNHFSVIINFKQSYLDSEYSPISEVLNFIFEQRSQ